MKKVFAVIICAVLGFSAPAMAQVSWGIRGGLNLASNKLKDVSGESLKNKDSYTGFFFGPTVDFKLPIVGIGVDGALLYSQSGMKFSEGSDFKLQYISVPLSLKGTFGLGNILAVLVNVGPQFDFNIGDVEKKILEYAVTGKYSSDKIVTTFNVGAGVRLFNKLDAQINYNMPFKKTIRLEMVLDGRTIVEEAISQKTLQFMLTYRF